MKGKWSTIYDQSLKVELDNGMRFVANFRYNVKPTLSANPLEDKQIQFADIHSGDYGSFDSDCGETMVGFVQSIPSISGESYTLTGLKATCFYGVQTKGLSLESTQELSGQDLKWAEIKSHTSKDNSVPVVSKLEIADDTNVQLSDTVSKDVKKRAHNRRSNPHYDHVPSDEMDLLIQTINEGDFGWKADVCKL